MAQQIYAVTITIALLCCVLPGNLPTQLEICPRAELSNSFSRKRELWPRVADR